MVGGVTIAVGVNAQHHVVKAHKHGPGAAPTLHQCSEEQSVLVNGLRRGDAISILVQVRNIITFIEIYDE